MDTALRLVGGAEIWLWVGAAVCALLLPVLGRFEPAARGAWMFRPLLIPGVLLLWPLVLWRLALGPRALHARHAPPLRAQAALGLAMAAAVAGALALGWAIRQSPPADAPALLVAPPP